MMIKKLFIYSCSLAAILYVSPAFCLFDVIRTNKRTAFNCQTGNIIVQIQGDENAVYVASTCIFVAGATSGSKKIDMNSFKTISLATEQTLPLDALMKGITYAPTQAPQKGYTVYLIAYVKQLNQLPQKISDTYKQQAIAYGIEIWRAVSFASSLLAKSTPSFELLQTLPANGAQQSDSITITPDGTIILGNDEGTITLPAQTVR